MSLGWPIILLIAGIILFAANLVVHITYALLCLRRFETKPPFQILPPAKDAPQAEPFRCLTQDGISIHGGLYYPENGYPKGVIIFFAEADARCESSMNYASELVQQGFAVVAFDFRNHGHSDRLANYSPNHWMTDYELLDARAVLNFVRSQTQLTGLPIGFMGVSRGANVALALAANASEVRHIWAQGAFSTSELAFYHARRSLRLILGWWFYLVPDWHVRVTIKFIMTFSQFRNSIHFVRLEDSFPALKDRGLLFVTGKRDSYVPPELVRSLCVETGHSPESDCWEVPKAKHNQERQVAQQEYDKRLVEFFDQILQDEQQPQEMVESIAS